MLASVAADATAHEVPLSGGRLTAGVVRVGDPVRRPTGPHSAFVHALLTHLEAVGYAGAPRLLGVDEHGREILSSLAGWVPPNLDHFPTRSSSTPRGCCGPCTTRPPAPRSPAAS